MILKSITVTPLRADQKIVSNKWYVGRVSGFDPANSPMVSSTISTGALSEMHRDGVIVISCESFKWV